MKYTKKPVTIEAVQMQQQMSRDARSIFKELPQWLSRALQEGTCIYEYNMAHNEAMVHIRTAEGTMTAKAGDWIIRGVKGELYPCKNDIFLATYEPAGSDADLEGAGATLIAAVEQMKQVRQKLKDDPARAVSIAITETETATLWLARAGSYSVGAKA